MVEEFRAGRILDGARAELSYVMIRNGAILQTWDERILLFEGEISQPIIGDPEEPEGFAAFSVEQQPYDMSRVSSGPRQSYQYIEVRKCPPGLRTWKALPACLREPIEQHQSRWNECSEPVFFTRLSHQ